MIKVLEITWHFIGAKHMQNSNYDYDTTNDMNKKSVYLRHRMVIYSALHLGTVAAALPLLTAFFDAKISASIKEAGVVEEESTRMFTPWEARRPTISHLPNESSGEGCHRLTEAGPIRLDGGFQGQHGTKSWQLLRFVVPDISEHSVQKSVHVLWR